MLEGVHARRSSLFLVKIDTGLISGDMQGGMFRFRIWGLESI